MSKSITTPNNKLCRFDLFVRLDPALVSRYPNNSLTWCHRGDKYTMREDEMLQALLRMFVKHYKGWKIGMIRDNVKGSQDPSRIILMYCNGIIEDNRLRNYSDMLTKIILPEWLR